MNYNITYLEELKNKKKKRLITLLVCLGIGLVGLIIMFIAVTYNLEILFKVLTCSLLTILGWITIYEVCFNLIPLHRNIDHISLTLRSNLEIMICKIEEISNLKTISKGIKGYEITCISLEQRLRFYFNSSMGNIAFKKGDIIKLSIKNNFIIDYEQIENQC